MLRFLLFSWLIILPALAANPKIFSGIGDPLYDDLRATEQISNMYAFKAERKTLSQFITAVQAAKKEGFALQKNKDRTAAKNYAEQEDFQRKTTGLRIQ